MNFIKVPDENNKPMLINLEEVAYIKTDNNGDAWIRMRNGEAVVTLIFTPMLTPILRKKYPKIPSKIKMLCCSTAKVKSLQTTHLSGLQAFLSGRGDGIRTHGLFVPNEALYQTEPHLGILFKKRKRKSVPMVRDGSLVHHRGLEPRTH